MAQEKQKKMKSMFVKVFGNYVSIVLLFALILGYVFINLFNDSNLKYRGTQMIELAGNTATRLRQYILDRDYSEGLNFIELFDELEDAEIWTIPNFNVKNYMSVRFMTMDTRSVDLQNEFLELLEKAYTGESNYETFYSQMHGRTIIAAAVPVYGRTSEVCGAIILIRSMEELNENTSQGIKLILISGIIAAGVAFIFSFLFTRQITKPVMQIEKTAKSLRKGVYSVKTGINQNDEIGSLAQSVDALAERLDLNENERKNMEQMRMDFFANVSHELRTPITVVRAYIESLVDGVITDEKKVGQYYERILKETKSMERLVGDLLTLSKMQNPDFEVVKEPVNLVDVFDEVVRSALAISQEKGIKIVLHRESNVYMMLGDYDRLRQLFMVVLDNAIKFSVKDSNIYMTLKSEKRKLICSIRDEGVGISEEELPNVFEKFYKSKLRQNASGTGLGLPIAKYIAQKHGGTVELKSKLGVGTEFIFTFDEVYEEDL